MSRLSILKDDFSIDIVWIIEKLTPKNSSQTTAIWLKFLVAKIVAIELWSGGRCRNDWNKKTKYSKNVYKTDSMLV